MLHRRLLTAGLAAALALQQTPAFAARPLVDFHRLDAYFALYARDSIVPWKPATVRLDTYTSAPVQFAVYQSDVADVISAGANTRPRAIATRTRRPIARWTYVPPGGYRFQTNDVEVPLGSREGFFVVEARRGDVGEQVWIDRTRVGLISKETPSGILLYGADLGTGRPLSGMRVSFIAGGRFIDRTTGRDGIAVWHGSPRPLFALAQWGASSAFVSFLPQAPLPRTIVGIKTDSAVVHAGDVVHAVGFARSRVSGRLRASSGTVFVSVRSERGVAVQASTRLDPAGAFVVPLRIPPGAAAGDYTILASINGASAGTQVHVDANADGISLAAGVQCEGLCDPAVDVPLWVSATRAGLPVEGVRIAAAIIRSPHAYVEQTAAQPWGIAPWYSTFVTTGRDGRALVDIPHPADGLASTYGVRLTAGGATADTRIVVPTSRTTVRIRVENGDIGSGAPAGFDLFVHDAISTVPLAHANVRVQLIHGASVQQQTLTTDERGRARGAFTAPEPGSNLIVASVEGADAMDAAEVQVEPQTMQVSGPGNHEVALSLDRLRYAAGEDVQIGASLPGAQGSALLTLESAAGPQFRVAPVNAGRASARFRIDDVPGTLAAGAAMVRDGALQWETVPLVLDAPGRPLSAALQLDRSAYGPGALATVRLNDVRGGTGTLVVRITKTDPTGSAVFATAPDLLAIGTTATQDTAVGGASWHAWVDSTGDHPAMQTFALRTAPPPDMTMTQADTASVYWKVNRHAGDAIQLPAPLTPGKYVLSLLKIDDDGRVTAASGDLIVQ